MKSFHCIKKNISFRICIRFKFQIIKNTNYSIWKSIFLNLTTLEYFLNITFIKVLGRYWKKEFYKTIWDGLKLDATDDIWKLEWFLKMNPKKTPIPIVLYVLLKYSFKSSDFPKVWIIEKLLPLIFREKKSTNLVISTQSFIVSMNLHVVVRLVAQ